MDRLRRNVVFIHGHKCRKESSVICRVLCCGGTRFVIRISKALRIKHIGNLSPCRGKWKMHLEIGHLLSFHGLYITLLMIWAEIYFDIKWNIDRFQVEVCVSIDESIAGSINRFIDLFSQYWKKILLFKLYQKIMIKIGHKAAPDFSWCHVLYIVFSTILCSYSSIYSSTAAHWLSFSLLSKRQPGTENTSIR